MGTWWKNISPKKSPELKNRNFLGSPPVSPFFCARRSVMMKKTAKLLVSPSRVLDAPDIFLRPEQRYDEKKQMKKPTISGTPCPRHCLHFFAPGVLRIGQYIIYFWRVIIPFWTFWPNRNRSKSPTETSVGRKPRHPWISMAVWYAVWYRFWNILTRR